MDPVYGISDDGDVFFADWAPPGTSPAAAVAREKERKEEGEDDSSAPASRILWIARDHFRPGLAIERSPFLKYVKRRSHDSLSLLLPSGITT